MCGGLAVGLCGCQSFSVPFAQWRAGYDSGLAKKITKEEKDSTTSEKVEDPRNLLERWLTPKGTADSKSDPTGVPKSDSPSSLVLGSDGWRPMLQPKTDPAADKELAEAQKLFKQGKLAEAESRLQGDRQEPKGNPLG